MLEEVDVKHLIIAAVESSILAGEAILEVYNSDDFQVNLKSDSTPLTLADRQSHESIKRSLGKTHIPMLSEEGRNLLYDERKSWDLFWLVDPLDGTKEFIKRNGEFTVNIALVENNYPVLGVIYSPIFETLYFGHQQYGAFKREGVPTNKPLNLTFDELIATSQRLPFTSKSGKFKVTASRSHFTPETLIAIEEKRSSHPEMEILKYGSSLKMCFVAEGSADFYPRIAPTYEWDTAAGQAINEAAGKKVVDADTGERLRYNKEELANPYFICTC